MPAIQDVQVRNHLPKCSRPQLISLHRKVKKLGDRYPTACAFLTEILCIEIERRASGGALEYGYIQFPEWNIWQLSQAVKGFYTLSLQSLKFNQARIVDVILTHMLCQLTSTIEEQFFSEGQI